MLLPVLRRHSERSEESLYLQLFAVACSVVWGFIYVTRSSHETYVAFKEGIEEGLEILAGLEVISNYVWVQVASQI